MKNPPRHLPPMNIPPTDLPPYPPPAPSQALDFARYLDYSNHARFVDRLIEQAHHKIPNSSVIDHLNTFIHFFGRNGYFCYDLALARSAGIRECLATWVAEQDRKFGVGAPRPLDFDDDDALQTALHGMCDALRLRLKELLRYSRVTRRMRPQQASRDHVEAYAALLARKDPALLAQAVAAELLRARPGVDTDLAKESLARDLALFSLQMLAGFRTELYCALRLGIHVFEPEGDGSVLFKLTPDLFKNGYYSDLLKNGLEFVLPGAAYPGGFDANRAVLDYIRRWHPIAVRRLKASGSDRLFLPLGSAEQCADPTCLQPSALESRTSLITALVAPELAPVGFSPTLLRNLCAGTLFVRGMASEARYLLLDAPGTLRKAYLPRFYGIVHEQYLALFQAAVMAAPDAALLRRLAHP